MSTPETFPKSVVLHFPPNVYQKIGANEILPQLLQTDLSLMKSVASSSYVVEKSV